MKHHLTSLVLGLLATAVLTGWSTSASANNLPCFRENVTLVLIVDTNRMELLPKNPKCVLRGEQTNVRIVVVPDSAAVFPMVKQGTVTTRGKSNGTEDDFLDAQNGAGADRFMVKFTVPRGLSGTDYPFSISVDGLGTIDPIVRVVDNFSDARGLFGWGPADYPQPEAGEAEGEVDEDEDEGDDADEEEDAAAGADAEVEVEVEVEVAFKEN
jgi:hypothetical protein